MHVQSAHYTCAVVKLISAKHHTLREREISHTHAAFAEDNDGLKIPGRFFYYNPLPLKNSVANPSGENGKCGLKEVKFLKIFQIQYFCIVTLIRKFLGILVQNFISVSWENPFYGGENGK